MPRSGCSALHGVNPNLKKKKKLKKVIRRFYFSDFSQCPQTTIKWVRFPKVCFNIARSYPCENFWKVFIVIRVVPGVNYRKADYKYPRFNYILKNFNAVLLLEEYCFNTIWFFFLGSWLSSKTQYQRMLLSHRFIFKILCRIQNSFANIKSYKVP